MVRRNDPPWSVHRLKRGIPFKEQKHLLGSYAQRRESLIPGNFFELEKSLVKSQGALQVRNMHRCFTDSAD
jgi:hypothetical protein